MSRIGRKAITLPKGVDVTVNGQHVTVKGAKGTLEMDVMHNISVAVADGTVSVTRANDDKAVRAAHGMTRALINNMVVGVGYRAQMQGKNLVLSLGFSHPVEVVPPAGIEFACESPIKIVVRGIDKQLVGQVASNVRGYRPPEPYKGKGIRYAGEYVIRKAGKAGAKK